MKEDMKPEAERTDKPNLSNGQEGHGNAQKPGDHLDRDRTSEETIPRKSSLL